MESLKKEGGMISTIPQEKEDASTTCKGGGSQEGGLPMGGAFPCLRSIWWKHVLKEVAGWERLEKTSSLNGLHSMEIAGRGGVRERGEHLREKRGKSLPS